MNRIVVFCGSGIGTEAVFENVAKQLGQKLAIQNIGLVYGGANIGLMGALADGVLMEDGIAIGVIPEFLKTKEIAHRKLTELILVETMHERKTKMNELADGVIALPGGFGTMEELFEMLTWAQRGLHKKPIGILNINGFYDELISLMETMFIKGFLKKDARKIVLESDNIDDLLDQMKNYRGPTVGNWITKEAN